MKKRSAVVFAVSMLATVLASFAQADVLIDGDFEGTGAGNAWTTFGIALPDEAVPGIDPGIEGAENLKMYGRFIGALNYSGAYQDVAVDGSDFSVGDLIRADGLFGHLGSDPLMGANTAFLEITFYDSSVGGLGEFGSGLFTSESLDASSPTDQYLLLATTTPVIPLQADFIRVKAIFVQQADDALGAAWIANISLVNLTTVPEPGSASLIAFGLIGVLLQRRRR